jgi:PTS system nitrogen regulatory IIA component
MTLSDPVDFSAPDGKGVDIVLVLLVPTEATQAHLDLLAGVVTFLSEESTRASIRGAIEPEDLSIIFAESGLL